VISEKQCVWCQIYGSSAGSMILEMMSFRRESAIGFQGLLAQLMLKSHYAESASLRKSQDNGLIDK
jgi:hypothetical protein